MKKRSIWQAITGIGILLISNQANATLLDFETLPDMTSVNDYYASEGVHFSNAISLTAGFSLNEFDFPPSSGDVAIGDDFAPIEISFDNVAENIFANFTYGSQLTFNAYDSSDSLIGSYLHSGFDNYGSTELISLSFTGVSSLVISGEWDGSFIMDDFNFEMNSSPIPEPATILLFATGLIGAGFQHTSKEDL